MENGFNEKAEKWYESKLTFLVSILVPIIAVVWFLSSLNTEIALVNQKQVDLKLQLQNLKDNDLHTITVHQESDDVKFQQLFVEITKLETLLNERLPKK